MAVAEARGAAGPVSSLGPVGFIKDMYHRIADDRVLAISAGATFYALLAVFPAVAAGVSLFGWFEDLDKVNYDLSRLSALLPGGAINIITEQVRRTVEKSHTTLGFAAVSGFLLSVWSANAGMKSLFDALNIVLREKERRGFLVLNGISLLFTFGVLLATAVTAAIAVWSASWIRLDSAFLFWPALVLGLLALWAALTFAIALLYRFGPSGNHIPWRWITWGSATTAIAWMCFSGAFSWYAANLGTFDKTYGSMGAAIGFMLWIWLSIVVILCGEETNEILDKAKKGERTFPNSKKGTTFPPASGHDKRAS